MEEQLRHLGGADDEAAAADRLFALDPERGADADAEQEVFAGGAPGLVGLLFARRQRAFGGRVTRLEDRLAALDDRLHDAVVGAGGAEDEQQGDAGNGDEAADRHPVANPGAADDRHQGTADQQPQPHVAVEADGDVERDAAEDRQPEQPRPALAVADPDQAVPEQRVAGRESCQPHPLDRFGAGFFADQLAAAVDQGRGEAAAAERDQGRDHPGRGGQDRGAGQQQAPVLGFREEADDDVEEGEQEERPSPGHHVLDRHAAGVEGERGGGEDEGQEDRQRRAGRPAPGPPQRPHQGEQEQAAEHELVRPDAERADFAGEEGRVEDEVGQPEEDQRRRDREAEDRGDDEEAEEGEDVECRFGRGDTTGEPDLDHDDRQCQGDRAGAIRIASRRFQPARDGSSGNTWHALPQRS